jgi:beta-N-acetylhexosaminidase
LQHSVALTDASGALLQNMLEHGAPKTMMIAMGNPYLAMDFPMVENYMCAFSNTSISEASVVKALFAEIEIRGRIPVTIPNIAARGSGIDRQPAQGGKNVSSINLPK